MPSRAFYLEMTAPLHVGAVGIGFEGALPYIPSDTLFSALVITWLEMGEVQRIEALRDLFDSEPPLLISSAFPYAGGVRFFPKPQLPSLPAGLGKEYKRVGWVSATIFQQLLREIGPNDLANLWQQSRNQSSGDLQNGRAWATAADRQLIAERLKKPPQQNLVLWSQEQAPHVSIDRHSHASEIFHVGQVRFAHGCGLWLMIQGEEEWLNLTETALVLLSDVGIGGRRSRGSGAFRFHRLPSEAADLPSVTQKMSGGHEVLLSRLAPTTEQMERLRDPGSSYSLVTVGGWSSSSGGTALVRQRVNMVAEGSIIRREPNPAGQLVDVKPNKAPPVPHPIYRYGFGLGVPIRLHAEMIEEKL